MKQKLSEIEKRLLLGAWQDRVVLGRLRPYAQEVRQHTTWSQHLNFKALGHIPADAPRWTNLGRTAAERKQLSRAYEALESASLLIRIADSGKTTHVKLTEKGLALARTLNAESAAHG